MSISTESQLRDSATTFIERWDALSIERRRHPDYNPDAGPSVDVSATYATSENEFILRINLVAYSDELTFSADLRAGYTYEQPLEVDHECALGFMESQIGPVAFTIVNNELAQLGRKFNTGYPQLSPAHQTAFWRDHRNLPAEEMTLYPATPTPS